MTTTIGEHGHVTLKADASRTNFVTLEKQVSEFHIQLTIALIFSKILKLQEKRELFQTIQRKIDLASAANPRWLVAHTRTARPVNEAPRVSSDGALCGVPL